MKITVFILSLLSCIYLFGPVEKFTRNKASGEVLRNPPTERMLDFSVMEFKQLAHYVLFFDAVTFVGGKRTSVWTSQEQEWFSSTLSLSSSLNPYSRDPYFLGQSILTWELNLYEQANSLLELGVRSIEKEWVLPFFMGFNYFYFLDNPDKGAEYISIARQRPEAPKEVLTTLASRLYYRAGRTEVGLLLLRDAVKQTTDKGLRVLYERRIKGLEGVYAIEMAMMQYQKQFLHKPKTVDDLVRAGFMKVVPSDPYGGTFFINKRGEVKTTSDFKMMYAVPVK